MSRARRPRGWRRAGTVLALALALALATPLAAQAPTSLHAAWIREVLDLDIEGAAAAYARLADDAQAPTQERVVAAARLTELHQHGVANAATPADLTLVPELLRQHFVQTLQPQPMFDREVEAGRGDSRAVLAFFEATKAPQLRPLVVATVLAAAEQANPSAAERLRQTRSRFSPWTNDPARVLDRIRASDVVRAELDGNADEAARLRRRAFPNWRPQPWPADAAANWTRIAANLADWQRERQLTTAEVDLLRRLHVALEQLAAKAPAEALQLLDRMPLYAERLRIGIDSGR